MISIQQLTKRYRGALVVDDVTFTCAPGTVTGFLGPNGAGKSTTLRMLCGLVSPTSGSCTIDAVPYRQLPNPGRQVGVLLDASSQHPGRTGRETLTLAAIALKVSPERVQQVLERVNLTAPAAAKRVGSYSLGMRQRLGLAQALLGDPSVLVLDEPANGLDPEGIFWMRELLRDFADRGGTVLLSSHLLREIDAVADHLVVINGGRVMAHGRKADLLTGAGTLIRGLDQADIARVLTLAGIAVSATADGALRAEVEPVVVARAAAAAGLVLTELRPADGAGLEDLFLTLTGGSR